MPTFAETFRQLLVATGDPRSPDPTNTHTGTRSVFYGLSLPKMRDFLKTWVVEHKRDFSEADWLAALNALYNGEAYEEKVMAGLLLAKYAAYRKSLSLAQFEAWLDQLHGWAEIDSTCSSTFTAKEVLPRWDEWEPLLQQLAADPNINKRRASIVLLIRPLRDSQDERLWSMTRENIEVLKTERDKLITKAISWVLREATKQHREAVVAYVKDVNLPAAVIREVTTKLTTGKKTVQRLSKHS